MPLPRSSGNGATSAGHANVPPPPPSVRIWRPSDFPSIELHHGSSVTLDYPRHWHDEIYLCSVLSGDSYLDCLGSSHPVPPGSLALVPSGEVHANRKIACTFRCAFIECKSFHNAVEQLLQRSFRSLSFRAELLTNPGTTLAFLRLHHSLDEPGSALGRDHSLLVFLHRLVARHSSITLSESRPGNEDFAVRRTKQFLENHFADHVSLDDLARLTGLSPWHLNRSFCRKIGMPPHAYQLQVRISQARKLLRLGRPISEIASLTGFVDQSHFTRRFKSSTGLTPGQYLRAC